MSSGVSAALHQRWAQRLLLRVDGAFWAVDQGSWEVQEAAVAGGGRLALWAGAEELSPTQAGTGQARDSTGNGGGFQSSLASTGLFRASEYGVHRASEPDHPAWGGGVGAPYLGDGVASSAFGSTPTMVARLLSFCEAAWVARRGARTRGQDLVGETEVSATHASHGGWADDAPLDHWTSPKLPFATAPGVSGPVS
jgi:hypothetical protein